jgi:hypothetical protein
MAWQKRQVEPLPGIREVGDELWKAIQAVRRRLVRSSTPRRLLERAK